MPKVRWLVKHREEAKRQGKKKSLYVETNIRDILYNWDENGVGRGGVKFIEVTYGRENFIELVLKNMEMFQKGLREHNKDVIIIYDRYDLAYSGINLGSQTVDKMVMRLFKNFNITRKAHELNETFELDRINEVLMELDDLLEQYDEYAVMDILVGD